MFSFFKKKKPADSRNMTKDIELIMLNAFPDGYEQRKSEATSLYVALHGKLTREQADRLLVWTKVLFITSQDLSLDRVSDGIYRHEQGRLTKSESEFVYRHITGVRGAIFSGGNGFHPDDPVIINCSITKIGVWAEKEWMRNKIGDENKHWKLKSRYHGYRDDGTAFETFVITTPDAEEISVHFDISQWYLKN